MQKTVIDIAKLFSKDLKSRSVARDLRDMIIKEKNTQISINFNGVIFVTRSFMDEFYNVIVADKDLNVELINFSTDMQEVLNAVKSTQRKQKTTREKNHPTKS